MTIANFKVMVEAWMNRSTGSFTVGSFDCLLAAMNDARRAAQRDHDFELLRTQEAYLTTSAGGADWATGCKTTPGGGTAQLMKRVDSVWQYAATSISGSTFYLPTARIPFDTSGDLKRNLPVVDTQFLTTNQPNPFVQTQFAYSVGTLLYVNGITTSTSVVKLFGIKYLDDLTGAESPDIFLTYFTDWFRIATIFNLNTYLKDSERFPIDVQMLTRTWESVKQMDGSISNMGEQSNLD
jgi:hypothetical protein